MTWSTWGSGAESSSGCIRRRIVHLFKSHASISYENKEKKERGMINNMFRRQLPEWGMIALYCLYLSGCLRFKDSWILIWISRPLAKDGTKASDIMDPGSKMLLFPWSLMAVFVGFLASRVAASFYDATSRERFSIKWWITLMPRSRNFRSFSLWPEQRFDLISNHDCDGDANRRVVPLWRFGLDQDLGQEQCLDNICWDRSLDGLDSSLFWFLLPFLASKGSRFDRCLNARDTGEFDWGAVVCAYNAEAYQNENSRLKTRA